MIVGDVIRLNDGLGVVRRHDRQAHMAVVQLADLTTVEVEDDLDKFEPERCRVLHNPSRDWPFVKVPDNKRYGTFVGITWAGVRTLTPFTDWLPTEFGKTGCVFVSPHLGLGAGDILIVQFDKGVMRINVPRNLATVDVHTAKAERARALREEARKPKESSVPVAYRNLRNLGSDDKDGR